MLELLDLRDRRERLEPRRFEIPSSVADTVRDILRRVREEGEDALLELTERFDGIDLRQPGLIAGAEELGAAVDTTPASLRRAIDGMIERVADLSRRQLPREWKDERNGVRFGEMVRPIRATGCYVPGGRANYPSSVCMTVTPAVVAGVEEIVVCTPPRDDGSLPPAVLYAAAKAGATRVVKVGGAQAIGALAYGTASVPAVDRVVGPGNVYVTEAKRQVNGVVGIDGLAGPTELVIVADATADPRWLAADLIAQAEHDPEASTTLITTEPHLIDLVRDALREELASVDRLEIVEAALQHARAVLVADSAHAIDVANDLAPEHLQLSVADPDDLSGIRNAGAIFIGGATPVPFGDYGVASNHVLPTAGTARFASGLRASDFVTVSSTVEILPGAGASLAQEVAEIARAEGLTGHARAAEIRNEGRT